MIILDTNVVSEPLRPIANPLVIKWLNEQNAETLYLTSVSLAKLLSGVDMLPVGKRKQNLVEEMNGLLNNLFGPRILPFDRHAAFAYAPLPQRARQIGHSLPASDGQIAAIALHNGFAVATRDTRPFQIAGVAVINPFQDAASAGG
jgi:predicted nucleic acid-binding protein